MLSSRSIHIPQYMHSSYIHSSLTINTFLLYMCLPHIYIPLSIPPSYINLCRSSVDTTKYIRRLPCSSGLIFGCGKSYLTHTQLSTFLLQGQDNINNREINDTNSNSNNSGMMKEGMSAIFADMGGSWNAWTSVVRQVGTMYINTNIVYKRVYSISTHI